ncbi:MAG: hypothetical protein FJX80_10785 [Bacteroidetes bacterium]|nr:hypothetical protein [Bacteroidota bacterium]
MRKLYINYFVIMLMCLSCSSRVDKTEIVCTDSNCDGIYIGPEFIDSLDIAHQFSNKMCDSVGDKLKALYKSDKYSKVDFSKIIMNTEGMGSGKVIYKITIPFIRVKEKCQAYTSFDHSGGWNHEPALSERKAQLKSALMKSEAFDISHLLRTKEGLQEYWIQWKNKDLQSECEKLTTTNSK